MYAHICAYTSGTAFDVSGSVALGKDSVCTKPVFGPAFDKLEINADKKGAHLLHVTGNTYLNNEPNREDGFTFEVEDAKAVKYWYNLISDAITVATTAMKQETMDVHDRMAERVRFATADGQEMVWNEQLGYFVPNELGGDTAAAPQEAEAKNKLVRKFSIFQEWNHTDIKVWQHPIFADLFADMLLAPASGQASGSSKVAVLRSSLEFMVDVIGIMQGEQTPFVSKDCVEKSKRAFARGVEIAHQLPYGESDAG
eukprot:gene5314-6458_t